MDKEMDHQPENDGAGPSSAHPAAPIGNDEAGPSEHHPDATPAADASVFHQRYRCIAHRPKQNKYQSQVSISKQMEKAMLPPHLAKITALTGGFYSDPTDAARASDKILTKLKRANTNGLLTVEEQEEIHAMTWDELMLTLAKSKPKTSIYRGVNWHINNKQWEAKITMHERRVVLGHHPLEVDAAKAYDVAAYYLLRDDARLNFKNEVPDSPAPELLARLQGTFSHGVRGKSGKGKQANTTSKYKGVFQRTGDDGWLVQVRHGGKTIPLGRLEGEDDAARLYDCAAYHLWQDSARLNFPNETPQPLESKWVEKLEAAATAASTADCLIELATRGGPSCGGGGEAEGEAKQHKKSLYRGVWWDASLERWELRIMVAEGKSKYLGQYETEEGAARAYDSVLFKLRGASAKLNFPDETPELPSGDLAARLAGSGKEGGSGGGGSDTKTDDEADPATGAGGAGEAQAGGHNGDDAGAEAGPSYVAGTAAAAAAADHGGDEAGPSGGAAAAEEGAAEAGTSGGAARGGGRKRAGAGGGGAAGGGGRKRAGAGAGGAEGGGAAKKGRMSAANKAIAAAAAAAAAAVAASDAAFEDLQSPPAAPASAAGGNEQGAAAGGRRATRGSLALLAQLAEAM